MQYRLKEEKNQRETLNIDNLLATTTINTTTISNQSRFLYLTDRELNDLSWIKPIVKDTTCSYCPPQKIQPNQAVAANRISENLLTEKQPDSAATLTVQSFQKDLERGSYEGKYVSIPLIDSEYYHIIANKQYKISENYETIKLMHINKYQLVGKTGVGQSSILELFSYLKFPTSEPVRIDFSHGTPECTTFGFNHNDFYIPYVDNPESRIVAILSYVDTVDKDSVEKPIAIGHRLISEITDGQFSLDWVVFNPSTPMEDFFKSEKKYPMFNLVFDHDNDENPPTENLPARITSFQPMYPSPLLTIHSIKVNPSPDAIQKGSQMFCNFILKTHEENSKFLKAAAKPNMTQEIESCRTQTLNAVEGMHFPGMCNFKLNTSYEHSMPLEIVAELYTLESGKTKLIADATIPIVDPIWSGQCKLKGHSLFSGSSGTISISYIFPTIVAPPKKLIFSLIAPPKKSIADTALSGSGSRSSGDLEQAAGPDYKHPMWQTVAQYMLQYCFDPVILPQVDFSLLAERIQNCNSDWLYKWIEHSFSCPDTFPSIYLKKLKENILEISPIPLPFFLVGLKGMIANHQFCWDELQDLLNATSAENVPIVVKRAAGEFIRQLRMGFAPDMVMALARRFIFALKTQERLEVFQIFFSDASFIYAIFQAVKPPKEHLDMSPYIPLLSLFYSTVRETFLANNKQAIDPAFKAIGLLGVSIEMYSDSSTSKRIAMYFFPLLTLIFTFADSLAPHLGNDPVLVPFILNICKNVKSGQFTRYFDLLSDDNKLRFFDFLANLSEESLIEELSKHVVIENDSQLSSPLNSIKLSVSLEVTCRLLVFLHFIDKIDIIAKDRQLISIFKIIMHMLSPTQDSEAFPMVFKSFAFVVNKFSQTIFIDKTNHILSILCSVVSVTQRKVAMARITAMAFLRWLVNIELCTDKSKKRSVRCFIGLIFACIKSLFENTDFEFKGTDVSKDFGIINDMIPNLKNAWKESKVYFKNVENLIHNFTYVENVQGALYMVCKQIEKINEENGDYLAAFLCQWKICALIANVFKLRNQVVDGIPTGGAQDFPFIEDSGDLKYNNGTTNQLQSSEYLLLEGDMFTEQSMCEELQKAMELSQQANLNWCIGQITEYLLAYLENHRMFDDLVDIYTRIANSYGTLYTDLEKGDSQKHYFYLVSFRGTIKNDLKRKNTIQILPKGGEEKFKQMLEKAYPGLIWCSPDPLFIEDDNIPFEKNKSYAQIVRVNVDKNDMENLRVCNFTLDVLKEEKGWDDIFVVKHQFVTGKRQKKTDEIILSYLPGMVSNVEIVQHTTSKITRKQYYMMYLKEYTEEIMIQVEEFRAVMPPKKLEHMWTKWSLWLNTKLLMRLMAQTLDKNPSTNQFAPLTFVRKCKTDIRYKVGDDLKDMSKEDYKKLIGLTNSVWDALFQAANVLNDLSKLNNTDRKKSGNETSDKILESYKMILTPSNSSPSAL
ncbi:hypothetical protein TVAG_409320 [Trichomonas vaginalis G3]|uniref:DOCKER Lobe A domain-containing protein n=1 Tax=Trichomonas vaginalis (strain ATCC PRA-98 / G3) TaxID=412133 RepID=A2G112_TRIV3|nr:dedicator of cytokinesis DOCK family [Trichomonas vaginalis G3]EAX89149.1 hypothetical protein TVAG_409320 [Trichomonas vaginalis G3]KAI5552606.1 dedicator of cytokinesis DOCK family [Trichomonas vaginalis G3]|eukprot:XP_001302079.1 hypothetical protein [Trichomonas vaginalis G3]